MNKGFSLMELMLVLALIGILAVITVPMILNAVTNSNEKAFLDTSYTINKAASNYYASAAMEDNPLPLYVTYEGGKIVSNVTTDNSDLPTTNYLDYQGRHPDSGNILINVDGTIIISIFDNRSGKCVEKTAEKNTPKATDKSKEECHLDGLEEPTE